jgi:tetratricopeptide (TPR) repeat protein
MLAKLIVFASIALTLQAQTDLEQMAARSRAAQEAERQNDFPRAVRNYQYLVKRLPRSAEMESDLGVALYFDHQLNPAIAAFRKAIALNPNLLAPYLFSGLAWYRLSNPDQAVVALEKAVRIKPSDVLAHTWLGYAYVSQSRYETAVKEFQATCELDPNDIDAWYALGQSYLQIGKDATIQLLANAPDGGRTWQLAGEQQLLQGDRQGALEDYKGALERRPDIEEVRTGIVGLDGAINLPPVSPQKERTQEDVLYQRAHGAEQKARAAFERVILFAPDSYRAHEIMADAMEAQQHHDKAVEEYRTVLKLKPDLPGIHEAIGNNLLRSGKQAEALKEFQAELEIQPRSASAHTNVAQVMLMMGDEEGAGKMLAAALQMDRPPPEVYRLLGKLDLRRKNYRSAVNRLTHYVSIRKEDSTAYYLLSRAYLALGQKDEMDRALTLFQKTSKDVKQRSRAQERLESLNNQRAVSEETGDSERDSKH